MNLMLSAMLLLIICLSVISDTVKSDERMLRHRLERRYLDPVYPDKYRVGYFLQVSVGTPASVPLQLTFDTGSSNLAVDARRCSGCVGSERYSPASSKSSVMYPCTESFPQHCQTALNPAALKPSLVCNNTWHLCEFAEKFVDSSGWDAAAVSDIVTLADSNQTTIAQFGAIFFMDQPDFGIDIDGISGWGYASNCAFKQTLWDSLRHSLSLPDVFSSCMSWSSGVLSLGKADPTLFIGHNLQYTPIISLHGYFCVDLLSILLLPF